MDENKDTTSSVDQVEIEPLSDEALDSVAGGLSGSSNGCCSCSSCSSDPSLDRS